MRIAMGLVKATPCLGSIPRLGECIRSFEQPIPSLGRALRGFGWAIRSLAQANREGVSEILPPSM